MNDRVEVLRAGGDILDHALVPYGFRFELRAVGNGSGGAFACGEYVRGNRKLALHFRESLGLVTYHLGDVQATHEWYVRAVRGASGGNAYPGFPDDPLDGFRHLLQDLTNFGDAFLRGTDEELRAVLLRAIDEEQRAPKGFNALP